jgi:hypothetical protein
VCLVCQAFRCCRCAFEVMCGLELQPIHTSRVHTNTPYETLKLHNQSGEGTQSYVYHMQLKNTWELARTHRDTRTNRLHVC